MAADGDLLSQQQPEQDAPRKAEFQIHPAADLFPRMSADEVAALAADIKANGQRVPILLDHTGEILIDGRHRLDACEIAEVEPWFENAAPDADPYILAKSLNAKRRDWTAGQKAISAAREWARAEAEGRAPKGAGRPSNSEKVPNYIEDPRKHFADEFGTNSRYVDMARLILQVGPDDLVPQVFSGARSIADIHLTAQRRRQEAESEGARLARLRSEAPDIAKLVVEGTITLLAGETELAERKRIIEQAIQSGHSALDDIGRLAHRITALIAPREFGVDLVTPEIVAEVGRIHRQLKGLLAERKEGAADGDA